MLGATTPATVGGVSHAPVAGDGHGSAGEAPPSILDIVRHRVEADEGAWLLEVGDDSTQPWILAQPAGFRLPRQGWKLHVSSYASRAFDTLNVVLPVLIGLGVAWKIVASPAWLRRLNAGSAGLSQIGKFITIYPRSDAEAVSAAVILERAMAGMAAPPIPSDRALAPNGAVHYRYGAFRSHLMQTALGEILPSIRTPGRRLQEDRRVATFGPPRWAVDPFAAAGLGTPSYKARTVAGRYRPVATLAESADIIVQLALDTAKLRRCVVKRLKVTGGRDVPELAESIGQIDREASLLAALQGSDVAPKLLDAIDDGVDCAVVMDDLDGESLDLHMQAYLAANELPPLSRVVALAAGIAECVAAVHATGHVHGDIKSGNILIAPDGTAKLIDFGLARLEGSVDRPPGSGTRGYVSEACRCGAPASFDDDLHALGAVLHLLLTGAEPSRAPDADDLTARPTALLRADADPNVVALVEACLCGSPERPRSARAFAAILRALPPRPASGTAVGNDHTVAVLTPELLSDRARRAGDAICSLAEPGDGGLVWRSRHLNGKGLVARDLNIGVAGTLLVLAELVDAFAIDRHRTVLSRAAHTLARSSGHPGARPRGLYVGETGIAVALLRAAEVLDDDVLMEAACGRAGRASMPMANPDLFHGMAGQMLGQLLFASATGERTFLDAARNLGDRILFAREGGSGRACWRLPNGYGGLSGGRYLGYAHGAAGIADALLHLFDATGDAAACDAAADAMSWVCEQAAPVLADASGVAWPAVCGGRLHPSYWCHGAAGIARALLHVERARPALGFADYLDKAARSVSAGALWSGPTLCHGLAGNAELLLDVWKAGKCGSDRVDALRLLTIADAFHRASEEGSTWISEAPERVSPDFMVGFAGVALVYLRSAYPERCHALTPQNFRRRTAPALGQLRPTA